MTYPDAWNSVVHQQFCVKLRYAGGSRDRTEALAKIVAPLRQGGSVFLLLVVAEHLVVPRLQPAGIPIIVVEARHMRVSLSTMRNKTDRNDARGIAQMMRLGWYRAVHVENIDMQKMRSLLANRKRLKRKHIENHIRGTLRAYGLLMGAVGRGATKHTSGSSSSRAIQYFL